MSLAQFAAILDAACKPFFADFACARFVQLYCYAHRIDGLEPGVYRHWPEQGELERIKSGDQRVAAAGLSLGQDLAGNACVAFSMVADLERAARAYGDRGYRYAHFEAGAMGHRLYLAAEATGLAGPQMLHRPELVNQFADRFQPVRDHSVRTDFTVRFRNRHGNRIGVDIETYKSYLGHCDQLLSYAALRRRLHLFAA